MLVLLYVYAILFVLPLIWSGFVGSALHSARFGQFCLALLVLHNSYGSDCAGSVVLLRISHASGESASHFTLFS